MSLVFNGDMVRRKTTTGRRPLLLFLFIILVLISFLAAPVAAGELYDEKGSVEELPPEERNYTGPCMGEAAFHRTWFDRTHSYLTSMLCQPSVWFDGFFGQHRAGEDWAGSLIRWENALRFDEEEGVLYRSEFRADFRLPKMNKKVKFVITSRSRDDPSGNLPDEDPYGLDSNDTVVEDEARTTAGLRYYLTDNRKALLSLGAGLKLGSPVQPYLRMRLRYTEPLGNSILLRLTPSAIWLREDGINRSLKVDLEQRLTEDALIRFSQSFAREELVPGTRWGSAATLYNRLSPVTVLALIGGIEGGTHPDNQVERYRAAARLRSNFLRDWLFTEVEPEYYWPRDDQGEYHLVRAITLRLEVQFYS